MKEYNFQDELIATTITENNVKDENTTLCIKNNYLEVTFEKNSWNGVAKRIISSCRIKKGND